MEDSEQKFLFQHPELWTTYILAGFRQYRKWLTLTLGYQYAPMINFCIARGLNAVGAQGDQNQHKPIFCMGIGLEIAYYLAKCQRDWTSPPLSMKSLLDHTLQSRLDVNETFLEQVWNDYTTRGKYQKLTLSDIEFEQLLQQALVVAPQIVDFYTQKTWRSTISEPDIPTLSWSDILFGEAVHVPATKHLGVQWLVLKGLLGPIDTRYIFPSPITFSVPIEIKENVMGEENT